jgi:CheY-like chemotaxis protein
MTNLQEWRVLIVEDEADSSEVVQGILEFHKIQSWWAGTAEEALEMMEEVAPNLLVVDLALPGMDGWGLLKRLRQDAATAQIPAVAVTAFHSSAVARQAIEAGFAAYFPKPIDTHAFVSELQRVLDN